MTDYLVLAPHASYRASGERASGERANATTKFRFLFNASLPVELKRKGEF